MNALLALRWRGARANGGVGARSDDGGVGARRDEAAVPRHTARAANAGRRGACRVGRTTLRWAKRDKKDLREDEVAVRGLRARTWGKNGNLLEFEWYFLKLKCVGCDQEFPAFIKSVISHA
jgi:hypothetical protein